MVSQPNFTTDPASLANVWPGRRSKITSIVCHTMSGSYEGTGNWFKNPAAVASSNFGIAQDGRASCYVDPFGPNAPFANGAICSPDAEFSAKYAEMGRANPNYWTVSIEHEDKGVGLTQITDFPSMFQASTLTSAWLCSMLGIDPSAPGSFLGHYQVDGCNRAHCPGWSAATWNSYITEVERLLS